MEEEEKREEEEGQVVAGVVVLAPALALAAVAVVVATDTSLPPTDTSLPPADTPSPLCYSCCTASSRGSASLLLPMASHCLRSGPIGLRKISYPRGARCSIKSSAGHFTPRCVTCGY
jgi:hypothetical protein